MTAPGWVPECVRAEMERGMALAREWRRDRHPYYLNLGAPPCSRCEGAGTVWWCGLPRKGGRKGPCPRCRVEGAKRFRTELAREVFDARGRKGKLRPAKAGPTDAEPHLSLAGLPDLSSAFLVGMPGSLVQFARVNTPQDMERVPTRSGGLKDAVARLYRGGKRSTGVDS